VLLSRQVQWATEAAEELRQQTEILEKKRKSEWIAKEVVLREYINQARAKAGAEEEADEGRRSDMMNIDEDGSVIESREMGNDEDELGLIPPYPYATPEEHSHRNTVAEVA